MVQVELKGKKTDGRSFAAAALFEVTAEHHASIGLLLRFGRYSSAQALLRSCVEASIRTVWLLKCTTPEQLDELQNEKHGWPSLESLIGTIEGAYKRGGFIRKLIPSRKLLNDLAHGGFIQIAERLIPHIQTTAGLDRESMRLLTASFCIRTSDRMLCLASTVVHTDLGDPAAADEILRLYLETMKAYETGMK